MATPKVKSGAFAGASIDHGASPSASTDTDELYDDNGNLIAASPVTQDDELYDDNGQPVTSPRVRTHNLNTRTTDLRSTVEKMGADPSDIIGSSLKHLGIGVWKGAQSTGTGILKLGRGMATGDFGPFDDPKTESEIYDPLEGENFLQSTGKGIEQMAEAFLPAGMVEKSIKATRYASPAKRIVDAMWKEAASGGAVAALQSGGDPSATVASATLGGTVRGVTSLPLLLRNDQVAKEIIEESAEFGIPITKAEKTQSSLRKLVDLMVARSIGGAGTMARFKVERNALINTIARDIADSVSTAQMQPKQMGQYIQRKLDEVREAATAELRAKTDTILTQAGTEPLDLGTINPTTGRYTPSKLVQAARDILEEKRYAEIDKFLDGGLGGTDNANVAYGLLKKFANPIREAPVPAGQSSTILGPTGQPIAGHTPKTRLVVKDLTVADARELRTLLFDMSAFDTTTTGKGSIQKLNAALHDELISTLNRAGLTNEAVEFEKASGAYKETLKKLESRLMTNLSRRGDMKAQQVAPETIAEILRGPVSESTVAELKNILKPNQMEKVKASLLRQTIEDTQHPAGFWDTRKFKKAIDDLGDSGGAELYGPDLYAKLKRLAHAADRASNRITPVMLQHAAGESLPLLAQLRLGGVGYMVYGIASSLKDGNSPLSKENWPELAGIAFETLAMAVAAKMLTRASVVDDLTKALRVDPMSSVGKQLAARLTAQITKEVIAEARETKRKSATESMHDWMGVGGGAGASAGAGAASAAGQQSSRPGKPPLPAFPAFPAFAVGPPPLVK